MQTKLAEIFSAQGKGNGRNYISVKEEDVALLVGKKIERDEKQFLIRQERHAFLHQ